MTITVDQGLMMCVLASLTSILQTVSDFERVVGVACSNDTGSHFAAFDYDRSNNHFKVYDTLHSCKVEQVSIYQYITLFFQAQQRDGHYFFIHNRGLVGWDCSCLQ